MDVDPLQIKDSHYAKPDECLVVEAIEGPNMTMEVISESEYSEKIKVVYLYAEEELIDFSTNLS